MKLFIAFIVGAALTAAITLNLMPSANSNATAKPLIAAANASDAVVSESEITEEEALIAAIRSQSPQFQNAPITVFRELSEFGFPNFYEISIGSQSMIVNRSGEYAVLGDLFQLEGVNNLSANFRNERLATAAENEMANISSELTIAFPANQGVPELGSLYIFTDPTCPYCQRLHNERETYAEAGVNLYYIPYPRSGLNGGRDYQELLQIMCADDSAQAMTDFKNSEAGNKYAIQGDDTECRELVRQGFAMGQRIGISGTPFIIQSTGGVIPGYNPARAIINQLRQDQ
ncbi:hypothetical protein CWE08_10760 [Aliidiomarina iranensis]|uniref:Thiol:disulfide interchange protein n=1 Tax=Aliidiomarina iranensis TaxID=1434071 RepID=A0A432VS63_9GAMM|nr:DsbC family protein [Aliidiomarina iranensis]RUO19029.1 hypothetical protein CWE08_10760 [Aliidiomarina iranensis]